MTHRLLFAIAMLGCLATTQARLFACDCISPATPCVSAQNAQAVFVGKVVEIVVVNLERGQSSPPASRRVSFSVTETFRGSAKDAVAVYTGSGGGDCGYDFKKGKSYLVYAHQAISGELVTSICARTREATRGAEGELKELRALAHDPRKCRPS